MELNWQMKLENRIYMLNETLLDDVEVDEVTDETNEDFSDEIVNTFVFNVIYSTLSGKESVEKMFSTVLTKLFENFRKSGYVVSFEKTQPNEIRSRNSIVYNVSVSSDSLEDFNHLLVRVISTVNAFGKDSMYDFKLRVDMSGDDRESLVIDSWIPFYGYVSFHNVNFYKEYFPDFNFKRTMNSFVLFGIKNNVSKPIDRKETRYAVFFSEFDMICVFDKAGTEVYRMICKHSNCYKYNEYDLALVEYKNDTSMFVDLNGKDFIDKSDIELCYEFVNGYASVKRKSDHKWNCVDKDGNFVSEMWFDEVFSFDEYGYAYVSYTKGKKEELNVIDTDGKFVFNESYREISKFDGEYFKVLNKRGEQNFADKNGDLLWKDKWVAECTNFHNGYSKVKRIANGKIVYNYVDKNQNPIVDIWFDDVCGYVETGVIAFKRGFVWNFLDIKSKCVMYPFYKGDDSFDNCEQRFDTYEGIAYYVIMHGDENTYSKKNYKFANRYGKIIGEGWYDEVSYKFGDIICATKTVDGKKIHEFYKTDGTFLSEHNDDDFKDVGIFADGIAILTRYADDYEVTGKYEYSYMTDDCKYIINDWFETAGIFDDDGYAKVTGTGKKKDNILAKDGNYIIRNTMNEPDWRHDILRYEVVKSDAGDYLIVCDKKRMHNVFDKNGNVVFKKWVDAEIKNYAPGILSLGLDTYVDYSGNVVTFV